MNRKSGAAEVYEEVKQARCKAALDWLYFAGSPRPRKAEVKNLQKQNDTLAWWRRNDPERFKG